MKQSKQAFTILELMIAVFIVGIIAVFALPDYRKSFDRTIEEDIIRQLQIIYIAQTSYFLRNNQYVVNQLNVNDINTSLNLDIVAPQNVTYSINTLGPGYMVNANYLLPGGGINYGIRMSGNVPFNVRYAPLTGGNPFCITPPCPTLGGP
jgi:prepilin-type N-terminal cleavage/methylation domain-containing protein